MRSPFRRRKSSVPTPVVDEFAIIRDAVQAHANHGHSRHSVQRALIDLAADSQRDDIIRAVSEVYDA